MVDKTNIEELSPESFWIERVSKRRPLLINGHLQDSSWKVSEKWNMEYLKTKAGSSRVLVEYRDSKNENFGRGKRVKMHFSEFLDSIAHGSEKLYLTTQPMSMNEEGLPTIVHAPLTKLSGDFSLMPTLLGNLIPYQVNLWLGCSRSGASSGLHHDYHDNLYVLLKGQKRFTLFSPNLATAMYTNGKVQHIHKNGRIFYQGQEDIMTGITSAKHLTGGNKNKQHESGLQPNRQDLSSEEADLDVALEKFETEQDDYASSSEDEQPNKKQKLNEKEYNKSETEEEAETETEDEQDAQPFNFSQVDLSLPDTKLRELFPNFPDKSLAIECTVHSGQMLYLPAGWFHNVTSTGDDSDDVKIHMALNYWFYPPDNLDFATMKETLDAFQNPYLSDYVLKGQTLES